MEKNKKIDVVHVCLCAETIKLGTSNLKRDNTYKIISAAADEIIKMVSDVVANDRS